jgi:hypothetical protein
MVERLPGHTFLVAAGIASGALWLLASQVASIFTV